MGEVVRYVRHGYSILEYARQYDKPWMEDLRRLRQVLNIPQAEEEEATLLCGACVETSSSTKGAHIPPIPDESVYAIMSYLDSTSLMSASSVSVGWRDLASRDELWCRLLLTTFSVSFKDLQL
eukprot:CAMPEP_0173326234 /NCGR_PEP_ID=MMETSP1144-20121109/952_1 /TAXON_ID=483371 /ORGANISM="non described non described, Strain CCMP2298" /LENGTH=122 /DNA_ID=CAMNT_0014270521 /DNA_START=121 /DNA_END=486 /DNA_ORIENTATION=+